MFAYVAVAGTVLVLWAAACVAGFVQGRREWERKPKPGRRHVGPTESIYADPWNNVEPGGYVESQPFGPAPIVFGTVSDVGPMAATRGIVPYLYVGQTTSPRMAPADEFGNMDDFAIDPMAPDSAKLTVEQAAIAFELWQINRWKPQ